MDRIRKRITYANVMSTVAVFFAIGGATAFAATQLGANSVGPNQIQQNAVRTSKLAGEAVRAGKLAQDSVPTNRLRDGAVSSAKIANGAVGAAQLGASAVTGTALANSSVNGSKLVPSAVSTEKLANDAVTAGKLAPGAALANLAVNVRTEGGNIGPETNGVATARCLPGEKLISFGAFWLSSDKDNSIEAVVYKGLIVEVHATNARNTTNTLAVQAICLG